jgi:hypothetical protein
MCRNSVQLFDAAGVHHKAVGNHDSAVVSLPAYIGVPL